MAAVDSGLDPRSRRSWALPLNNPPVVPVSDVTGMRPDDLVVGVCLEGRLRAYPWWIVANFHVVNDTWLDERAGPDERWRGDHLERAPAGVGRPGGRAVVVTLCEACSSVTAFVPQTTDGTEHGLVFSCCFPTVREHFDAFGTFTMCDLKTLSRWHPAIGIARSGPLEGKRLQRLPAFIDRWADWQRDFAHSEVVVAAAETRHRPHVLDLPNVDDPEAVHSSLQAVWESEPGRRDERLAQGDLVLGVEVGDSALAIPGAAVNEAGGILHFDAGPTSAFAVRHGLRLLAFNRRVGGTLEAWTLDQDRGLVMSSSGQMFDLFGRRWPLGTEGPGLEVLASSFVAKWSAWSAFFPGSSIFAS